MPENQWVDTSPFRLAGGGTGFLLVHGFAGTPATMRLLGEALAERRHTVLAPRLPGHGTTPEELAETTWEEWATCVGRAHHELSRDCDRVILVGQSAGGLLALDFAADHDVDALVLTAPAVRVRNPLIFLAPLAKYVIEFIPETPRPKAGLTSDEGWKYLWHYERRPMAGIAELLSLQRRVKRRVRQVVAPTVIFQGLKDLTVHPAGAEWLLEHLGSEEKKLVWLPHSGHCLTVDVELGRVVEEVRSDF